MHPRGLVRGLLPVAGKHLLDYYLVLFEKNFGDVAIAICYELRLERCSPARSWLVVFNDPEFLSRQGLQITIELCSCVFRSCAAGAADHADGPVKKRLFVVIGSEASWQ